MILLSSRESLSKECIKYILKYKMIDLPMQNHPHSNIHMFLINDHLNGIIQVYQFHIDHIYFSYLDWRDNYRLMQFS